MLKVNYFRYQRCKRLKNCHHNHLWLQAVQHQRLNQAKLEFNRALHLFPQKKSNWQPKVTTCSAITGEGISAIWETILSYMKTTQSNQYFFEKRAAQNQYWMLETINEYLKNHFYNHPEIVPLLEKNKEAVANNALSPFAAAQDILDTYFKK